MHNVFNFLNDGKIRNQKKTVILVGGILVFISYCIVYMSGQHRIKHQLEALGIQRAQLKEDLKNRQNELGQLEAQVIHWQSEYEIQREIIEKNKLEIKKLQAQLSTQVEENSLYRTILGTSEQKPQFQIRKLCLSPSAHNREYALSLILSNHKKPKSQYQGEIKITITDPGNQKRLVSRHPFKFKYFQEVTGHITIPESFKPQMVRVEVLPQSNKLAKQVKKYAWSSIIQVS